MIRKIATAAVYVDDQGKAVEFWTKHVGFKVHREKAMGPRPAGVRWGLRARSRVSSFIQSR
jgi:hypothetical protein